MADRETATTHYHILKFHPYGSGEWIRKDNIERAEEAILDVHQLMSTPAQQYLGFVEEVYEVTVTKRRIYSTHEEVE